MSTSDPITIGCASAFWGDSVQAFHQLAMVQPPLHVICADFLAEVTVGLLARRSRLVKDKAKAKPGFIEEIIPLSLGPLLSTLLDNGTKFVVNAGGLDPVGLKDAIEKEIHRQGLDQPNDQGKLHKVAAVYGDDLYDRWESLSEHPGIAPFSPFNSLGNSRENMLPSDSKTAKSKLLSLNAYVGSQPIADALNRGATIVVTGRVVDSALVVGPLLHYFGWSKAKCGSQGFLDRLASASLAGHIIECGAQCTGGNFTDWKLGAFSEHGGWSNMGYGIVHFPRNADGLIFDVTKAANTGGIVSPHSVGEQMLYEVLDPENYILPDVVLDLSDVTLTQVDKDVVRVQSARGRPPPAHLKCTAILSKGYKVSGELAIIGEDAKHKAEVLGRAILNRARRVMMDMRGFDDFIETRVEVIGAEAMFGAHGRMDHSREVFLRLSASHEQAAALFWVSLELAQAATSTAPAITGSGSGRARPAPLFSTSSILIPRESLEIKTLVDKEIEPSVYVHAKEGSVPYNTNYEDGVLQRKYPAMREMAGTDSLAPCLPSSEGPTPDASSSGVKLPMQLIPSSLEAHSLSHISLPLIRIAVGRSGDKGDTANIAFLARKPEYYPILRAQITPAVVRAYLAHLLRQSDQTGCGGSEIIRYDAPGVHAINFVVTRCLGGGGLLGLQLDRQAKSYAQIGLSALRVRVPVGVLSNL